MQALELPEQHDTLHGVKAPVETIRVFGHDRQAELIALSYQLGRMHHALLLEGPLGIGKASFAFQLAQHLVAVLADAAAELDGNGAQQAHAVDGIFVETKIAVVEAATVVLRRCRALAESDAQSQIGKFTHLLRQGTRCGVVGRYLYQLF